MRISDWSSDVCSSDLHRRDAVDVGGAEPGVGDGLAAGVGGAGEGGQAEAAPDLGDADAGYDRPRLGGDHRPPASGPASTLPGTTHSTSRSTPTRTGTPHALSARYAPPHCEGAQQPPATP